jgi:predicted DNA-binding protein YlxM (UPF0122 family)
MPLHNSASVNKPSGRLRRLADRTAVIRLFDAYAGLLTVRQQTTLRMYYHEDLSLGEIAGRLRISRQAVSDRLRRSVREMRWLEERLGVLADGRRNGAAAGRRGRGGRNGAAARLAAVECEAARLTASGAATGPLLRALRALRAAL